MKPCPFCGGSELDVIEPHETGRWVYCVECGAMGPTRQTYEMAVSAWDERKGGKHEEVQPEDVRGPH